MIILETPSLVVHHPDQSTTYQFQIKDCATQIDLIQNFEHLLGLLTNHIQKNHFSGDAFRLKEKNPDSWQQGRWLNGTHTLGALIYLINHPVLGAHIEDKTGFIGNYVGPLISNPHLKMRDFLSAAGTALFDASIPQMHSGQSLHAQHLCVLDHLYSAHCFEEKKFLIDNKVHEHEFTLLQQMAKTPDCFYFKPSYTHSEAEQLIKEESYRLTLAHLLQKPEALPTLLTQKRVGYTICDIAALSENHLFINTVLSIYPEHLTTLFSKNNWNAYQIKNSNLLNTLETSSEKNKLNAFFSQTLVDTRVAGEHNLALEKPIQKPKKNKI